MTIRPHRSNCRTAVAIACSLALIGYATLRADASNGAQIAHFACLLCDEFGGPDLVLNVLLFVPLGVAMGWLPVGPSRALGISVAISLVVELTQLALPGRAPALRDVLSNGLGGGLGALLSLLLPAWLRASTRARAALWVLVGAVIAVVALTGQLLRFAPPDITYFGHWSPRQAHLEHWTGTVVSAALDGVPVPFGPLEDAGRLRTAILDGFDLTIEGIGGRPTARLGGIMTISDERQRQVLLVGVEGTDLVFRVARWSNRLHFDSPEFRFRGLLTDAAEGAPFTLRLAVTARAACATIIDEVQCIGPFATGSAWTFLRSYGWTTGSARILLNALVLVTLAMPAGLFLRTVPRAHAVAASLFLLVGTALAAHHSDLALPTLAEWLGLGGGLVAGIAVSRLVTRASAATAYARRVDDR